MFIWDYILIFRMEVDLVWKSKLNFMKGLYLLQRYSPFIDTLGLVLYRQSSVSLIFLCSFFLRSNGGKFDGNYMLETILRVWRFVMSTRPRIDTKLKELILCPVFMVVGLAASESKFNITLLVRGVLIRVYQ
jgi:Family of unknown function (DUF6533)